MITIKLSYSILNAWAEKRFEDAIAMYLGKSIPDTPYFELGRIKHKLWERYTLQTDCLAPELGGGPLINPVVEQKWQKIIPLGNKYQILIRGVIDLETTDEKHGIILTDYKCGVGKATSYVDKWQLDMYKFLRPQASLGQYICHNPYKCEALCQKNPKEPHKCFGVGIKFLDNKNSEDALNNIITYGGEMIEYFESNKLIKDYKLEHIK